MLLQIIPTSGPLYAVFADDNGNAVFEPVACLGCMETNVKGVRVVTGFPVGGVHLEPAEARPNHVGYSATEDSYAWEQRCRAKREEIVQAEAEANKTKLYVPEQKKPGVWQ